MKSSAEPDVSPSSAPAPTLPPSPVSGATTPAPSGHPTLSPSVPRVTIIIPTYERIPQLTRLLQDLEQQTYPRERLEVLVVDDASPTDPTASIRNLNLRLPVKVLRVPHGGPARARNRALAEATGDYVLFLNDDVQVAADLVDVHISTHRSLDLPVAVLGTFSFTHALREDLFSRVLEDGGFTHTLQLTHGRWYNYQSFWTGNLSLPRAVLATVHGFDEDFDEASHDDLDLGLRLEKTLGLKVYFTDAAISRHDHRHDPSMWRRRNRMVGRNILRMHLKHGTNDLDLFKVDGRFSRQRLLLGQQELHASLEVMAQLDQVLTTVLNRSAEGPVQGVVKLDEHTFFLPDHTEPLLATCLSRLTHHDQLEGLIEAALQLPDLVA